MANGEREKMQDLREWAEKCAKEIESELWKRAYLNLADAADKIDAMITRTIDIEGLEIEGEDFGTNQYPDSCICDECPKPFQMFDKPKGG